MKTPLIPLAALALALSTPALAAEQLRGSERRDGHQTPSIRDQVRASATRTPNPTLQAGHDAAKAAGDARAAMTSASAQDSTQAPGAGFSGSFDATATAQLPPPPIMEPLPGPASCRWRYGSSGIFHEKLACAASDDSCTNQVPTGYTLINACSNSGPSTLTYQVCQSNGSWQLTYQAECGGT